MKNEVKQPSSTKQKVKVVFDSTKTRKQKTVHGIGCQN
jgi:hypothetical protein